MFFEGFRARNIYSGFRYSKDGAVDKIERDYKFSFGSDKPKEVDLNSFRNRMAFRWHFGSIRKNFDKNPDITGIYLSDIDMYFQRKNAPEGTTIHEAMHALIMRLNRKLNNVVSRNVSEDNVTYQCINEGLCRWVENDITKQHKTYSEQEMAENFVTLHNAMKDFTNAYNNRQRRKAWKVIERLSYDIGYNFVSKSLDMLGWPKKDTHDALEYIIKNPPQTFGELENPYQYIKERLGLPAKDIFSLAS